MTLTVARRAGRAEQPQKGEVEAVLVVVLEAGVALWGEGGEQGGEEWLELRQEHDGDQQVEQGGGRRTTLQTPVKTRAADLHGVGSFDRLPAFLLNCELAMRPRPFPRGENARVFTALQKEKKKHVYMSLQM